MKTIIISDSLNVSEDRGQMTEAGIEGIHRDIDHSKPKMEVDWSYASRSSG
uniref:Uncharacterized protein n=1 Tax=Arion vulgaris TaxID=1028688 RepID=A0A0B7BDT7_9EUPU